MSVREQRQHSSVLIALLCAAIALFLHVPLVHSQLSTNSDPNRTKEAEHSDESELQIGTRLTRAGRFQEAIPHLVVAQGRVSNPYAADFNLALCYVATRQSARAIPILARLRGTHENVQVENLLAQAYVGSGNSKEALAAVRRGAALRPGDERLYLFVADACTENKNYELGLDVVDLGIENLPKSAALHYQRAMLLSSLDEFDASRPDFRLAKELGAGGDIGYLAAAQESLLDGKVDDAIAAAREGNKVGGSNYRLLTILGEALLRSGITPGQPPFAEAEAALSKAVSIRPNYSDAQLALGRLNLISHRLREAISHLEEARALDPQNPAIYSNLAAAYREQGDRGKAQQVLSVLAQINREQAEKISSAPGERKPVAGASRANRRGTPKD